MSSNLTLSVLLKYIFCCMFHKDTNVCNICISSRLRMIYQNYDSLEITYCFSATTHLKPIWSVRKLDSDRHIKEMETGEIALIEAIYLNYLILV